MKQNETKQKTENIIDKNVGLSRFFELATTNKRYVNSLNLHEVKNEFLLEDKGDLELNGSMIIGPIEHKTNIRFENMDDFETFIDAIGVHYDSEDVTFTGYVFNFNTLQFNRVSRSPYARGTICRQDIFEFIGNNCFIPTSGKCYIKYNDYFTEKDYTEEFLTFIGTEQRRSHVMTSARIQPFCRKYNINIGCFDGTRINPRNLTQRNKSFFLHINHSCLIWKSQNISFNQAI